MKLTERTLKNSDFSKNDLVHIVDVSDKTQSPEGSSFKSEIGDVVNSQVLSIPTPIAGVWKDIGLGKYAESYRFFVQFDVQNPSYKTFMSLNPKLILGYRKNRGSKQNNITGSVQAKKSKIVFPYRGVEGGNNGNIEFKFNFNVRNIVTGVMEGNLNSNMNWYLKSSPGANDVKIPLNFHDKIIINDLPIWKFFLINSFTEEKTTVPFNVDLDTFLDYNGNPVGNSQLDLRKTLKTGRTSKNNSANNATYTFYFKFVCDNPDYNVGDFANGVSPIIEGNISNPVKVFARHQYGKNVNGFYKTAFILNAI